MDQFKVPPPTYAPIAGQPVYGVPQPYNNSYMRTPQVAPMIYTTPIMTSPPIMTPPPMMYPQTIPSQPFMGPPPVIPSQPFMGPPPIIPSQPFMGPSMVSPGYGVTPNLNVPFSTNIKYYD
ncbi:hypothetical protein ACTFIU_008449 [Dictyostelium citrinum]